MTPRNRNRINQIASAQKIKRITAPLPCEPCADLKYVPDFTSSIMTVHNLTAAQVPDWYHARKHSIFPPK